MKTQAINNSVYAVFDVEKADGSIKQQRLYIGDAKPVVKVAPIAPEFQVIGNMIKTALLIDAL